MKLLNKIKCMLEIKRYNVDVIKVKRCMSSVLMPKIGSVDAAGMDFYQPESITIEPHQTQYVTLGIAMEIPKGYMLMLAHYVTTDNIQLVNDAIKGNLQDYLNMLGETVKNMR